MWQSFGVLRGEEELTDGQWFRGPLPRMTSRWARGCRASSKEEMGVGRDGEKAESGAPVQGGTHAWAERVPTNKHLRALKGPLPRSSSGFAAV